MKPEIRSKMIEHLERAIENGVLAPTFGRGLTDDDFTALRHLVQLRGLMIELSARRGNVKKTYYPTPDSEYVLAKLKDEEAPDDEPPSNERPLGFRTT